MKNKNGFTKQEFLKLLFSSCPFCESEELVQWYDEKTKIRYLICNNCDYYSEERFVEINWGETNEKKRN